MQVFYGTVPLVGAILLAIWSNNKRLDDLKTSIDKRIDDLTTTVNTGFSDVKAGMSKLETSVSDLEKGTRLIRG